MVSFLNRTSLKNSQIQPVKGFKAFLLAMFLVSLQSSLLASFAQGLVGAPVNPCQGTCYDTNSSLAYSFSYEQAVVVLQFLVAVIVVVAFFLPIPKKHCGNAGLVAAHLLARVAVPVLVFFVGCDYLYHSYDVIPSFFTW